jgi:hypothetical protein
MHSLIYFNSLILLRYFMATTPPQSPRIRTALSWWRGAASAGQPPHEADFVSQDPQGYAELLGDALLVDAGAGGDLTYRYVGTELADYIGRRGPGQLIDLRAARRDSDLIRDVLVAADATSTPKLGIGRITTASATGSGALEVLCLPLRTGIGGAAFFVLVGRVGLKKLPPAPHVRRLEITSVIDL